MKTTMLSLLLVPVLVAVAGSTVAQGAGTCTPHDAPGVPPGTGSAVPLSFSSGILTAIEVVVPTTHLRPWVAGQVALDITVTSVNGKPHFHGTDIVPLSETEVFFGDPILTDVIVTWTVDTVPIESPDNYTISVQLIDLATSTPLSVRRQTSTQF